MSATPILKRKKYFRERSYINERTGTRINNRTEIVNKHYAILRLEASK